MGEVECDPVLWGRHNLPDAVLVDGVQVWETGGRDAPVAGLDLAPACIWRGRETDKLVQ